MRRRLPLLFTLLVALTCISVLVEPPGAAAQNKKSISCTYHIGEQLSSTNTVYPGDNPKHEYVQFVRHDVMKSSDPDFNLECILYQQTDAVAGTGSYRGLSNCADKDGNKAFFTFDGTYEIVAMEGGKSEVRFGGGLRWTGGTGKFKNLKGLATYKGKDALSHWESEVEY